MLIASPQCCEPFRTLDLPRFGCAGRLDEIEKTGGTLSAIETAVGENVGL
jgi:hypothetical protein